MGRPEGIDSDGESVADLQELRSGGVTGIGTEFGVHNADASRWEVPRATHLGEAQLLAARNHDNGTRRRLREQKDERVDVVGHPQPRADA